MFRRAYYAPPPSPESGRIARISPPPSTSWTLREYLRLLLQGRYDWIGEVPPRFGYADHREFAERIYRRTRLPVGCDPLWICEELGIDARAGVLPQGTKEVYANGRIIYPARKGARLAGLLLAHGITHHESERTWHGEWTHADEWLATLELLVPQETLFLAGLEAKERLPFAPEWLLEDYWDALTGHL